MHAPRCLFGLSLGLLASACFEAPAADVMFACDPSGAPECPAGYTCEADGCCHRNGSDANAAAGECRLSPGSGMATSTGAESGSSGPATGPGVVPGTASGTDTGSSGASDTGLQTETSSQSSSSTASGSGANMTAETGIETGSGGSSTGGALAPP